MFNTIILKNYGLCPDIGTQRVYYEIFVEEKSARQSASLLKVRKNENFLGFDFDKKILILVYL